MSNQELMMHAMSKGYHSAVSVLACIDLEACNTLKYGVGHATRNDKFHNDDQHTDRCVRLAAQRASLL